MDKAEKYKKVAMVLLKAYMVREQKIIKEFALNRKILALYLREEVLDYLKDLDEREDTFNELVKDMWISQYYETESEE